MKETYTRLEVITALTPIVDANDKVQELADRMGGISDSFLKSLSDLDWAIKNVGEDID